MWCYYDFFKKEIKELCFSRNFVSGNHTEWSIIKGCTILNSEKQVASQYCNFQSHAINGRTTVWSSLTNPATKGHFIVHFSDFWMIFYNITIHLNVYETMLRHVPVLSWCMHTFYDKMLNELWNNLLSPHSVPSPTVINIIQGEQLCCPVQLWIPGVDHA